jgi:hypothetical protein
MPVQTNAATWSESSPDDHHSDDDVNRSQHIQKVGNLKHGSCLAIFVNQRRNARRARVVYFNPENSEHRGIELEGPQNTREYRLADE